MYFLFKRIFFFFIPKSFIYRFENGLRSILSIFYIGKTVNCNICERRYSRFILHKGGDLICPGCGSLDRHRRLWYIIQEKMDLSKNSRILHFSPSRIIQKKLKRLYPCYYTSDFENRLFTDYAFDITNISENENIYDLIICYHVLEHIIEDDKAIKELYRVLKKKGELIVQTPFKKGDTYEDFSVTSEKGRLEHFGQEDHVRIYSVEGLKKRIEKKGFSVEILEFSEEPGNIDGFKTMETVLICRK